MVSLFQKTLRGGYNFAAEIVLAKTVLIPKNKNTKIAKTYRPTVCLNLMCKLYISCLNLFVQDHCGSNEIITDKQAGGKKDTWGCAEQLLINKTVLKEVKKTKTTFDNCLVRLCQGIGLSITFLAIYGTAFS